MESDSQFPACMVVELSAALEIQEEKKKKKKYRRRNLHRKE